MSKMADNRTFWSDIYQVESSSIPCGCGGEGAILGLELLSLCLQTGPIYFMSLWECCFKKNNKKSTKNLKEINPITTGGVDNDGVFILGWTFPLIRKHKKPQENSLKSYLTDYLGAASPLWNPKELFLQV